MVKGKACERFFIPPSLKPTTPPSKIINKIIASAKLIFSISILHNNYIIKNNKNKEKCDRIYLEVYYGI